MITRETLLTNWHLMRWIRLFMGIYAATVAIQMHDTFSGIIAALFLFQALTNTGCCGAGSCTVPIGKKHEPVKDIEFEEIKDR